MEGVTTSTSSEFEKELDENKVQSLSNFAKNFQKKHEFENILGRMGGACVGCAPLDPPLKNINFVLCHFQRFVICLQRERF